MDVDEDDDGGHSRDANLVPLEIHSLPGGLWVTVIDRGQELQAQWDVMTFLLNLFQRKMKNQFDPISTAKCQK